MKRPATVLCILDGFGLNPETRGNAIAQARKPNFDRLWNSCPRNTLITHGERVGLPDGQMGNSEVGHLNIGAGRVVEQWLLRISRALQSDFLEKSGAFSSFCQNLQSDSAIHLIGLFSDGGVHSHSEHLKLLIKKLCALGPWKIWLHLITDGRDTSPFRAGEQIHEITALLKEYPQVRIKSLCGRFFAMDRDKRWERTQKAYRAIFEGQAPLIKDPAAYIQNSYEQKITDEFMEPAQLHAGAINANDGVIFWNFREDRVRQITAAACLESFNDFPRAIPAIRRALCFTEYDHSFKVPFLFSQLSIKNHLGEVVAAQGLRQLRVAETEKYPHVTYFFNGGVETPYAGESRKIVPSPRDVKTYDLKPEMSAAGVCQIVLDGIRSGEFELIVVNFANCDMVGHTGVIPAAIKAVETVDGCLGEIAAALEQTHGQMLVIADHGNADYMLNDDGTPSTAHTKFPVPVIGFNCAAIRKLASDGALCDVAPTILDMMELPKPAEMSGRSLRAD
ncbi:MAG: 2,3-bisphosphoglycerate-independent phosphoglycerate mutase [Oligoflexia bacterium]|nr:2,3-bisphosphoglycerate-independent phosphoglycerate mutase [Oligoflexia bacterium]